MNILRFMQSTFPESDYVSYLRCQQRCPDFDISAFFRVFKLSSLSSESSCSAGWTVTVTQAAAAGSGWLVWSYNCDYSESFQGSHVLAPRLGSIAWPQAGVWSDTDLYKLLGIESSLVCKKCFKVPSHRGCFREWTPARPGAAAA